MINAFAEQAQLMADAGPLMQKYDKRIEAVGKHVETLSDYEAMTMAVLLDNTEKQCKRYARMKNLSDTTYSESVGPFIKHSLNIVSAIYTTFDLKDLISVQALKQKIGALYYLAYTYGSNKGSISAGATMFSAKTAPTRTGYYSSQEVKSEAVTLSYVAPNTVGTLGYFPLASIGTGEISIVLVGGTGAGTYTYLSTTGNTFNLQKGGSGSTDATLQILTGVFSIVGNVTGSLTSTTATYVWNSEKYSTASPIPRVSISVEEEEVRARRRQLLFEISLDATFDFDNQYGRDLNSELESTIIQEMQNEMAYLVLDRMFNEGTGNNSSTYTFDLTPPATGIDLVSHSQRLWKVLAEMSTKIFNNLGRGRGNKIVTGDRLIEHLSVMPDSVWKPTNTGDGAKGPYKAGRLLGKYDVFHNMAYGRDDFIMTYKGNDWWEAPFYTGVYLPLMSSKFMMFPDMHGEQGYISMEANKFIFPQHVVKGTVTNT